MASLEQQIDEVTHITILDTAGVADYRSVIGYFAQTIMKDLGLRPAPYYPDFLVKLTDGRIVVVETKGQEDLDVPLKVQRIRQWCEDINGMQSDVTYTSMLLLDALVGASVDTDRASQRLY